MASPAVSHPVYEILDLYAYPFTDVTSLVEHPLLSDIVAVSITGLVVLLVM